MKSSTKQEITNIISKTDALQVQYESIKRTVSASAKKSAINQIVKAVSVAINEQRDVTVILIKTR